MASSPDALEQFQSTLEPYIKPREQVNYIRRVLALQLGSYSQDGPIQHPVSLADVSKDVDIPKDLKGVHRSLVEALKNNVEAQRKFDEAVQTNASQPESRQDNSSNVDFVAERVGFLKLHSKHERISIIQKYLDEMVEKPAALPEYLDPETMFQGTSSLPSIPKEVVNGIVAQQITKDVDLGTQTAQLEKTVLRAKLLLRREEQLLRDARINAQCLPDVLSNGTRLEALNTARNELINWIETELGKASGEEAGQLDNEPNSNSSGQFEVDKATIRNQLDAIKEKYAAYLTARKTLLSMISERTEPPLLPAQHRAAEANAAATNDPAPNNYLLTPYISTLLSLSRKQRDLIAQKSHMTSALNRATKEAGQVLTHMAEESQLLPAHSTNDTSSRRRSGLGEVLTSTEKSGLAGKTRPWVFAADASKIATLEVVAETVENGQLALENSMKAFHEIDQILGQSEPDNVEETANETSEDFWLESESADTANTRKHTDKKGSENQSTDMWSLLHGNLGLIGHEDTA